MSNYLIYIVELYEHVQHVSPRPPKSEEEEYGEDDAGDFACVDVETARYKTSADERRAEVSCWKCDEGYSARHSRCATLIS